MDKIHLSQIEKVAFLAVYNGTADERFLANFSGALVSLYQKGLIYIATQEDGQVVDARLTDIGRLYILENPKLNNGIDWPFVISIIAAAVAVAALFVACYDNY